MNVSNNPLAERSKELSRLADAVVAVTEGLDLSSVLQKVVDAATAMTGPARRRSVS